MSPSKISNCVVSGFVEHRNELNNLGVSIELKGGNRIELNFGSKIPVKYHKYRNGSLFFKELFFGEAIINIDCNNKIAGIEYIEKESLAA